jgi:hypothetical protein
MNATDFSRILPGSLLQTPSGLVLVYSIDIPSGTYSGLCSTRNGDGELTGAKLFECVIKVLVR